MRNKISVLIAFIFAFYNYAPAQEANSVSGWDNTMYVSNKFNYRKGQRKNSFEFQSRFNENYGELEQWHLEAASTFLISEKWEVVPDFRFTRKPTRVEYRPGIGAVYKHLFTRSQLVHQVKYQYDIKDGANNSHGLRYAAFYNYLYSEKIILTALGGGLFELGEDWDGFLGYRVGLSGAYVFDEVHSVNLGYFYGMINDKTNNYSNIGIFSIQLIINMNRNYKYIPAKYFSF